MSRWGSIPGWADWVVNGNGPTAACDPVSRSCSADFPEFGGPSNATCPAPSGWTTWAGPVRAPPLRGPASSSVSSLIRVRMSAWRCSVPLCLGSVRSISWSPASRSSGVRAERKSASALLYSGETFVGISNHRRRYPAINFARVPPVLQGRIVRLRPAEEGDIPDLVRIRQAPDVYAHWRGGEDLEAAVREDFDEPDSTGYVIELAGRVVGWIQWQAEEEPDYRHASMDIYVDPAVHGRGVGTDAVRTMARHLIDDHGHHR